MAEPFKNLLSRDVVRTIGEDLRRAWPRFPADAFRRQATRGLETLELKDRGRHIAAALKATLPADPTRAMEIAIASLGPPLTVTEGYGSSVFRYLPLSTWLHEVGPLDVETALTANRELTRRFTAEFSIRSLLAKAQARTLTELSRWTRDSDPHVRRLVSEGTRPRLPWAERVPSLRPESTLPLLEALKGDESEYVRRSVANHLNDLSKDHPQLVLTTARRWLEGAGDERRRLVEHALRTLVKAGQPAALELLGASGEGLEVKGAVRPGRVRLGASVGLEATVSNEGRADTHVVVEAVVHFVRPAGTSAKKFRLARFDLPSGETRTASRRLRLEHRSIRTLHAGVHRVEVQANGRVVSAGRFVLALT